MNALPLGRPLRYRDFPFVQPVRGTREPIPRFETATVVSEGPQALIDDVGVLASAGFDPARLHPCVRGFFERSRTTMFVDELSWERWALPLAAPYVPLAAALGNLRVPDRLTEPTPMTSSVRILRWPDGTTSREWIRTFAGTSALFFAAALRPWSSGEASFLSMAFPFGRGHLLVLLRVRHRGDAMVISTRDDDLAGTYAIVPLFERFVALPGPPTHEVLTYSITDDGLTVLHEDFLGPRRTFAMRYRIPTSS